MPEKQADPALVAIQKAVLELTPRLKEFWAKAKNLLQSVGLRADPMAVAMLVGPISMQDGDQVERLRVCLQEAVKFLKDIDNEREAKKLDPRAAIMMAGTIANACEQAIQVAVGEVDKEIAATINAMLELAAAKIAGGDSVESVYSHILIMVEEAHSRPVHQKMQADLLRLLRDCEKEAKAMHARELAEADTMTNEEAQAMVDQATPEELKEMLSPDGEASPEEAKEAMAELKAEVNAEAAADETQAKASDDLPDAPTDNVVAFAPKKPARPRPPRKS